MKQYGPGIFVVLFFVCFFTHPKMQQHINYQRQKVQSRARLDMLNLMMPASYEDLLQFVHGDRKSREGIFIPYITYYKLIVEYMPQRDDGYAMLAFCYYYDGQAEKAASLYKQAVKLNPNFFWSLYNLGIVYFNEGEYHKARQYFNEALHLNPEFTMRSIFSSKIYQDIMRPTAISSKTIEKNLKTAYQNCYKMLRLSEAYEARRYVPDAQHKIHLEIF